MKQGLSTRNNAHNSLKIRYEAMLPAAIITAFPNMWSILYGLAETLNRRLASEYPSANNGFDLLFQNGQYTITEIIDYLVAHPLTFSTAVQSTNWAESNQNMGVFLNDNIRVYLASAKFTNLNDAEKNEVALMLAVVIIHEVAHCFIRYGQMVMHAKPYLTKKPLDRTPEKILKQFGVDDFGKQAERWLLGGSVSISASSRVGRDSNPLIFSSQNTYTGLSLTVYNPSRQHLTQKFKSALLAGTVDPKISFVRKSPSGGTDVGKLALSTLGKNIGRTCKNSGY